MINPDIALQLYALTEELMIDRCQPNKSLLDSALSFDASTLDSLDDITLSKFVIVLGQYLVYLKYKENEIIVEKVSTDREFNRKTIMVIKEQIWKTNVPLKEKINTVCAENPDLQEIQDRLSSLDAQLALLDGMYASFIEYINTFKREQGRRQGETAFPKVR